jgi:hypothetical protein
MHDLVFSIEDVHDLDAPHTDRVGNHREMAAHQSASVHAMAVRA